MCEKRNARKIQVEETEGKALGRPTHRRDDNIKINKKNVRVCIYWMHSNEHFLDLTS
jgi:hypothetical protein